jgi:hypothetical protein
MKTVRLTQPTLFLVTLYTRARARLTESFDKPRRLRQAETRKD